MPTTSLQRPVALAVIVFGLIGPAAIGCGAPQRPMIPAERISQNPVPSGWVDTTAIRADLPIECYLLMNSARDYRTVQMAGIGVTTLGIIGALATEEESTLGAISQVATLVGTVTQLAAGTGAMVKENQAIERGCFD